MALASPFASQNPNSSLVSSCVFRGSVKPASFVKLGEIRGGNFVFGETLSCDTQSQAGRGRSCRAWRGVRLLPFVLVGPSFFPFLVLRAATRERRERTGKMGIENRNASGAGIAPAVIFA